MQYLISVIHDQAGLATPDEHAAIDVLHEALLNLLADGRNFDAVEAAARQHKLNSLPAVSVHEASAGSAAAPDRTA